jgi:hypothetical protein
VLHTFSFTSLFHILSVLAGTAPIPVEDQVEGSESGKHDVQIELEANLLHTSHSNMTDVPYAVNTSFEIAKDGQKYNCEVEDTSPPEMNTEISSNDKPLSNERSECVMPSRNKIYAVDVAGHCVPVDFAWTSHNNNHCNYAFVGNSKMHDDSSQSSSVTDSEPPQNGGKREETKHDHPSSKESSFHATVYSQDTSGPFNTSFSTAQAGGNGQAFGSSFNYMTSSSSNSSRNGFMQQENLSSSSTTTETSSQNQPQGIFGAAVHTLPAVHILPETLVNGAINVASQAYTTARAVLSNLRSRPSEVNIYFQLTGM